MYQGLILILFLLSDIRFIHILLGFVCFSVKKRRNFVAAICRYYASNSNKRINYTVYEEYRTFHQKRRPCVGEGL